MHFIKVEIFLTLVIIATIGRWFCHFTAVEIWGSLSEWSDERWKFHALDRESIEGSRQKVLDKIRHDGGYCTVSRGESNCRPGKVMFTQLIHRDVTSSPLLGGPFPLHSSKFCNTTDALPLPLVNHTDLRTSIPLELLMSSVASHLRNSLLQIKYSKYPGYQLLAFNLVIIYVITIRNRCPVTKILS